MKYLILLGIVVQALAAPPGRPGNGGPVNRLPFDPPSRLFPPPDGSVPPFGHPDGTGPPPHDDILGTRPPPPNGFPPRQRRAAGDVARSAPPPKPIGENPPPSGKPPVNGPPQKKPGQPPAGNDRPKRHVKGVESHPTRAPHVENHTHDSTGSHPPRPTHPLLGSAGEHQGEKGHGSGTGKGQKHWYVYYKRAV
ncbi:uncharacterized protein ACMZJ9_015021 [Mantella aurantiaca]